MLRRVTLFLMATTTVALCATWFVRSQVTVPARPTGLDTPPTSASATVEHSGVGGERTPVPLPAPATATDATDSGSWIGLRVLDRDSRRDLTEVVVVRHHGDLPPNDDAGGVEAVVRGDSPLRLPGHVGRGAAVEQLAVRAPGYAWQRVRVRGPGDREVWLERAGGLSVAVDRESLPTASFVRIRSPLDPARRPGGVSESRWQRMQRCGGDLLREAAVASALPVRFTCLPVGPHVVRLEVGWDDDLFVLAETQVVVTAGTEHRVDLSIPADRVPPRLVAVTGTLHVPEGWPPPRLLCFDRQRAQGDWSRRNSALVECGDELASRTLPWGPVEVVPGRYRILVEPLECTFVVDIADGPTQHVENALPPPVAVGVRVVDEASGQGLLGARLYGTGELPLNAAEAASVMRLPPGRHRLSTWPDDAIYDCASAEVEIAPGVPSAPDVVLRVRRVCGVAVTLCEGDAHLPWDPRWHLDLLDANGKSVKAGAIADGRVVPHQPGTYSLLVEDVDGYQPIPLQRVTLERGGWTKVLIPLQRQR